MSDTPWLSVIMPTYNGETFIDHALNSLVAQRSEGLELVAVDDGSTDRTVEILRAYSERIRIKIHQQSHVGNWVVGTNIGLRSAAGDYVSLLHQDDVWMPGRLRHVRAALASAGAPALLVHPIWFIDPDGRRAGAWRCPLPAGRPLGPEFVLPRLLIQDFIPVLGTVFPRDLAIDAGGMDPELWYTADWDLWLRLAAKGPTWHLGKRLAAYRIHPKTQTATRSIHLEGFRQQLETVLERHLDDRTAGVIRPARFSVEVNVALAALSHGRRASILQLVARFLALGPVGWWRYLRYSRILERAGSRARVSLRRSWKRSQAAA
jgi:glycosyltransferase involved in cell wall biosynthesis